MTQNLGFSPSTLHKGDLMLKAAMNFVEDVSICPHTGAAPNFQVTMHHSGLKDKALPTMGSPT